MKTATYTLLDGSQLEVEYDPETPCWMCGLPVIEASTSGTTVCPWCDSGRSREGHPWDAARALDALERFDERLKAAEADYAATLERQAGWRLGTVPRRDRASALSAPPA
jgi:hypothetical protein